MSLDLLISEAKAIPSAAVNSNPASGSASDCAALSNGLPNLLTQNESEAQRILQICNACRYCEGFCAVFPAMTKRLEFAKADINYLANLCHNCGSCLHACQYADPHEFDVNVPRTLAQVRLDTYTEFAWPKPLGNLYKRNGLLVSLATAAGVSLFLIMVVAMTGNLIHEPMAGNFYGIFPHNLLVVMFGLVFLFAMLALGIGTLRFARQISTGTATMATATQTGHDVLTMKYLDGGHGKGCNNKDDAFTLWRRRFHHFTFYGFMLCFAATSVGTIYHYVFGWIAPYDYLSLPVILGTLGGIGLIIGPIGLLSLNLQRDPNHGDQKQKPMDLGFIVLLFLISLTGLLLMILRDTSYMGIWLAIHLGTVMALFITMPYGKFAHGFYRTASLLKWASERKNH